jgi:hypothetical protein
MQTAYVVAKANAKDANAVAFSSFRLKFGEEKIPDREEQLRRAEFAKARVVGMIGGWDAITEVDIDGNVIKPAAKRPGSAFQNPLIFPSGTDSASLVSAPLGKGVNGGINPRTGASRNGIPG